MTSLPPTPSSISSNLNTVLDYFYKLNHDFLNFIQDPFFVSLEDPFTDESDPCSSSFHTRFHSFPFLSSPSSSSQKKMITIQDKHPSSSESTFIPIIHTAKNQPNDPVSSLVPSHTYVQGQKIDSFGRIHPSRDFEHGMTHFKKTGMAPKIFKTGIWIILFVYLWRNRGYVYQRSLEIGSSLRFKYFGFRDYIVDCIHKQYVCISKWYHEKKKNYRLQHQHAGDKELKSSNNESYDHEMTQEDCRECIQEKIIEDLNRKIEELNEKILNQEKRIQFLEKS